MRKIKAYTIFTILILVYAGVSSQVHNWSRTNPGGGGWFSCIGAGLSGTVLAGSDLSGAYRSKNGGASWDVIGPYKGLNETHISGIGFL